MLEIKINTKRGVSVLLVLAAVFSFLLVLSVEAPSSRIFFEEIKKEEQPQVAQMPEKASLLVPYTVQAPFADWKTHDESCEEAAVLMYHYFLSGDKREVLDQYRADAELKNMKTWQVQNLGKEPDLTIEELGRFTKNYYGYKYEVKKNITAENIKREIAAGRPVMVPVMTHALKNPHYNVNDSYHILLIKGYDEAGVITNDAGVKEGKSWHYTWDILWQAIDAQTPKMAQGRDFLILSK